ncbi:hypothetical protein PPL_10262 [Heterostelium album PN500]|uniref:Uncharacterized protein n=1 Tax=Heterostelium pallidum (strain ATCC 26659 / Pp 5 / PN500) TaxID=670386 RepID=D3BQS4_HETP5|nr:hypothetical protein PPL_10262 [Heterostelium album PN500]EFA76494.1 hypothetical protein PPL_10262 [Heterostelium album PN500]|eukprot:XP_020428626.1 hypothetical protein PPL_10262 [Heterostelium album PN500]
MQVIIGTDIDRNQLYPSYPKIDSLYTQTLYNIDPILQNHKWSANVIPLAKSSTSSSPELQQQQTTNNNNNNNNNEQQQQQQLLTKNQFDLEKLARWFIKKFNPVNPLTFVYGLSFFKKGSSKTIDMITLKSSPSGKSFVVNLVQTFRLQPQLDYFKDQEDQRRFESENLPAYTKLFTDLEHDCQTIKNLVPSTSVSIYNPFFDKHTRRTAKIPSPLTVESSFLLNNNNNNNNNLQTPPTTTSSSSSSSNTTNTSQQQSLESESPRTKKQQSNVKHQQQQQPHNNNNSNNGQSSSTNNNIANIDQVLLLGKTYTDFSNYLIQSNI